jgi:hypothetical protein
MRNTFLLAVILFLLGNQDVLGQCTVVKGQVVNYTTGKTQPSKVEDCDSGYVFIESTGYSVKIYNIPRDVGQVDLGKIKMVPKHLLDGHILGDSLVNHKINNKNNIELDNKVREEVLQKYRLYVNGKELKPRFEGSERIHQRIVFDFKDVQK